MAEEGDPVPPLVVFTDYSSPTCWVAERMLDRLRADAGIVAERRPFERYPAPAPLPDPTGTVAEEEWRAAAAAEGWPAALAVRPALSVRTRKAHEAAMHAAAHGRFAEMHEAIFVARFARGRDIGRIDVLVDLGVELALDRTDLKVALDIDKYTDAVIEREVEGARLGVRSAPTFVLRDGAQGTPRLLEGLTEYERLRRFATPLSDGTET